MTDEQIIKALECSPLNDIGGCRKKDALDLINRQKAEIERLETDKIIAERKEKDARALLKETTKYIKSEAIKEFAERLKAKQVITHKSKEGYCVYEYNDELIDNLVAEMTESPTKIERNSLCETETYKE